MKTRLYIFTGSFLFGCSLLVVLLMQGCSSLSYYQQAVSGQYELLNSRVDIQTLVNNEETPVDLKQKLSTILQIRAFASNEMAMDVGNSYAQYSDLKRDYVVWNVSASPELSLKPHQWCYPIIGCQSYRGYFNQPMAEEEAAKLQLKGYDTWVGGVSAYSTLGWFDDPVLNTFIFKSDADLASLLIHELSHQILYIKGDTAFNESFATAVELEGLSRWLKTTKQEQLTFEYQQKRAEKALFIKVVSDTTKRLRELYESTLNDNEKRITKQQLISELKINYHDAVIDNNLTGHFTHWFDNINNAKLMAVSNYYRYVPAFSAMIEESEGDMHVFYQLAKALGDKDEDVREHQLQRYLLDK